MAVLISTAAVFPLTAGHATEEPRKGREVLITRAYSDDIRFESEGLHRLLLHHWSGLSEEALSG